LRDPLEKPGNAHSPPMNPVTQKDLSSTFKKFGPPFTSKAKKKETKKKELQNKKNACTITSTKFVFRLFRHSVQMIKRQ